MVRIGNLVEESIAKGIYELGQEAPILVGEPAEKVWYQVPVPESWTSWLQGFSVWGEAQNLFTLTKYTGNDPEFSIGNSVMYQGIDCGNIALSRAFVLGLKINL